MLVSTDLDRFVVFNNREQTLVGKMGKEEFKSVEDVEEGEISDSTSVEEISEEDFIKQEVVKVSGNSNIPDKPRVWTMRDLYKYPISQNYASGLYNLAWAQAVQNKPLDDILVKPTEDNSNLKQSSSSSSLNGKEQNKINNGGSGSLNSSSMKEVNNKVIIDVSGDEDEDAKLEDVAGGEEEEGELEEGEIDLDSEVVQRVEDEGLEGNDEDSMKLDTDVNDNELKKRINSIREELETVTKRNAEKSYHAVCSRLHCLLDSLWELVSENSVSRTDALIQLSFTAIQTLKSVFCSMNQNERERNKDILSRLLSQVISQNHSLFTPEQMKEIELMTPSLDPLAVLLPLNGSNEETKIKFTEKVNQKDFDSLSENAGHDVTDSMKIVLESMPVKSLHHNDSNKLMEPLKLGTISSKGRGMLLPLLDLHKDHDEDSLPSPTRATPSILPMNNALAIGGGAVKPEWPLPRAARETEDAIMHPYETDALKAVSSYQQKFGRSSFFMIDRLPSPTPSEEFDDGDGNTGGEISSSSIVGSVKTSNGPILAQSVSSPPHLDASSGQGLINVRNAGPGSSGPNTGYKSSAKSRDPRLRFANPDIGALDVVNQHPLSMIKNEPKVDAPGETRSSRKQKAVEEPILDGPALKRQRSGLTDSEVVRDVQTVAGSGCWLDDRGTVGPNFTSSRSQVVEKVGNAATASGTGISKPNITINGSEHWAGTGNRTKPSLHSLLKNIAVNPAMWMNIIKMEQQKSIIEPSKGSTHTPSSSSILGEVPSINVTLSKPSVLGQKSAGILQTPQTASTDESGKIRMKPRDPRRILHGNIYQKGGNLEPDQFKANAAPASSAQEMKGNLSAQKQDDQSDKKSMPSQSTMPPDITWQFTKNLKNIADIISVSQASMTPPVVPQNTSLQVHSNRVDIKGVVAPESGNLQSGSISSSEEVAAGPSQSQNTWADVEHLFDGFDDQQKAAIHRERARRIEEQKKLFAANKLCLVLDLDHTLLNSAKFAEVDLVHDEILKKKEEQDREKPYKHLFRFPHMGMWTKLRPGIWNFLEKASKLYELHLYTMGNKLYATEMAKLLDPKGVLFAGRVISRGDDSDLFDGDERVPKNKDLDGVLGMESGVVIVDDSVRVWPHNKLNLIVVERYIYFPCSRRQFGLAGPSLLEIDHDERPEEGTLASSLAVIERIHQNFFSHRSLDEADVRNILASEQRKILAGCRIVFSRVFPVGEANPHLHPLWQTAEQFGAVCTNQIDEQVTHVVANSLGTDKVNWALSTGRFVVHPGWVEASALLYRRANENDFAVKP
ncbi:RNA polymerase II C-terminal domain phosphatase-like [Actinidia chinensis var. chinensis]|uniref:protein-serine/threonine phosphatase n=1 Tax=Actinidia chinensis var. chinensis TaxID=1590841 RepID=A0A2R6REL8_ACTCC|nr:RNA polymerase II C-terminal domain phosphatase-like [Actinidia chinensis var. chinensis]